MCSARQVATRSSSTVVMGHFFSICRGLFGVRRITCTCLPTGVWMVVSTSRSFSIRSVRVTAGCSTGLIEALYW